MNAQLPGVDFVTMREWRWPAWKFGLDQEELFTTLYQQYNTHPSPLQNADAFHHDVYEIAKRVSSADEFHRLLAERKEQRLAELREAFNDVASRLVHDPKLVPEDLWGPSVRFFHKRTMDSLVEFFASFLPDRGGVPPGLEAPRGGSEQAATPTAAAAEMPTGPLPCPTPTGTNIEAVSPPPTPPGTSATSATSERQGEQPPPPKPAARRRKAVTQTPGGRVAKRKPQPQRTRAAGKRVRKGQTEEAKGGRRYNLRPRGGAGDRRAP